MFYGEKKKCAGSYSVKGYTREDGTKVQGYTRTCGAKHAGKDSYEEITGAAANLDDKTDMRRKIEEIVYSASPAKTQEILAKNNNIPISFFRYYKLALDFENEKYLNNDNIYLKVKDISTASLKDYILNVCPVNSYTNVVSPLADAKLVKEVIQSSELKDFINTKFSKIASNYYTPEKGDSINFDTTRNVKLTIGKSYIYYPRFGDDGCFYAVIVDYYDFTKSEYKSIHPKDLLVNHINDNAVKQQELGKMTNYVLLVPIQIKPDEMKKLGIKHMI